MLKTFLIVFVADADDDDDDDEDELVQYVESVTKDCPRNIPKETTARVAPLDMTDLSAGW